MKNSIIFVSAFSVVSIMMVSCASEPQTTTTATHHTTVTLESSPTLTQAPGGTVTMTIILGREIGAQIQANTSERERARGKNRPICEEIWISSEVLHQGDVRHLRQMAAAR